ncbi:hypothetical protein BJX68DRAFT_253345 [Aspergillus pseudodeflectus]|uniref:Zn(2)-C6 fungal-type domain-containing protein n=1 Tax=Aspergillus pseudodeflectus TaxID=176178 RepID=A0ABR4KV04_9EURO
MSAHDQSLRGAQKRLRATHTKSRQGCYTCKSRRVKCDEAKPICGACALRNAPCGYPRHTSRQARRERQDEFPMAGDARHRVPAFSHDGSPRALDFNLPSPPAPTAEVNPGSMNMVDLRLLSHFIIRTSKRMSLNPYRQKVWETVIPGLAADHDFLMHLVLALAGLDHYPLETQPVAALPLPSGGAISSDNATPMHALHHMQVVVGHHQCGLQGFRDTLSTLSDSNCNAVFAGSMLLVAFAFASLRVRNWSDSHMSISTSSPLPTLRLDWIYLIRGLTTVVRQCWPALRMGPFREILQYAGATEDWKMYPDTMFTNVTAPAGCSPRIARFCRGAYEAISRLKALQESTPSPMDEDSPQSRTDHPSSALKEGLDLLESMYMRILYVVQFSRDQTDPDNGVSVAVAIQADMENAAVMGWPQALSEDFLASLGSPDVKPNASLVVLAHLYLTLALFEATWFLNGAFDEEIMKIDALFKASRDETFVALMQWPVSVLNG